jgi:small subunit ribosomal protein S9
VTVTPDTTDTTETTETAGTTETTPAETPTETSPDTPAESAEPTADRASEGPPAPTGTAPPAGDFTTESSVAVAPREISDTPGAATGRRKEAIARVRITPGTGQCSVNGKTLEDFFPNKVHQQVVNDPFRVLQVEGRYDVVARVHGGGVSGQAGAIRLGISRALSEIDTEGNRPSLKKAGYLTRDPRAKERRKAGLKKARKAPQYSKR